MRNAASSDFLRRLSVADAKVLLERTKREKEAKTKEMQKMIGVRYRDLIESADRIVTMHSAAIRLETTLKEMPDKWRQMETRIDSLVQTQYDQVDAPTHNGETPGSSSSLFGMESVRSRVTFLVSVPEMLWRRLDDGETLEALKLFHLAKSVVETSEIQEAMASYPFLAPVWASIASFDQRIQSTARACLACRGQTSRFYAQNLATLATADPQVSIFQLLEVFLKSRLGWLECSPPSLDHDHSAESSSSDVLKRQLRLNLRVMLHTVTHIDDIFYIQSCVITRDRSTPEFDSAEGPME
ncbi:hypothetical protein PINS_up001722 [Pythium insidiosum]|nr:hypothetical protein PINS_up001722 [Pythium insidiosum]